MVRQSDRASGEASDCMVCQERAGPRGSELIAQCRKVFGCSHASGSPLDADAPNTWDARPSAQVQPTRLPRRCCGRRYLLKASAVHKTWRFRPGEMEAAGGVLPPDARTRVGIIEVLFLGTPSGKSHFVVPQVHTSHTQTNTQPQTHRPTQTRAHTQSIFCVESSAIS